MPAHDVEETILIDSLQDTLTGKSRNTLTGASGTRLRQQAAMPDKIGKYLIDKVIGKGGMGTVYLGREPVLDRYVAIKTLLPFTPGSSKDERRQLLERFLREAKSIARINHKNIVNIYGLGKFRKSLYLVMEYVDGPSISDIIRSPEEMPFRTKIEHMIQMCEGLGMIHKTGLVHRDIKPGNIMLTMDGTIKIMDFGAVHTMDSNLTRTEQILGTPSYMSPEQVQGMPPDSRSDIFSLGAVFYQFLTNEKPFSGDTFSTVAYRVTQETPPPASRINPLLPSEVDEILGKCLAKSPEDRYASTDELANALRTLLIRQHRPKKQTLAKSSRSTVFALLAWSLICLLLLFAAVAAVSWRLRIPESLWVQVETMVSDKMGTRVEQQPEPPPPDKKPINAPVIEPLKFQYNVAYKPANRPNIRRLRNGDVLSIGDTYRVSFTPEQNCHAYVYMIINGIDVMQLFPEGDLADAATGKSIVTNPVHKGQVHNLPASKPPYKINGPPGSRDLYFIATRGRNLDIEKFYKILKTARAQHDEKIIKIYRFKTRMRLKKTPVESTPEDHNISLPWEVGGKDIDLVAQKIDSLCPDCAHITKFTVR